MSIDGRARSYGKIWGGWTIGKMLGQGSGGKTAVFKLSRTNLTFTEECAMKVINIVEEQLDYDEVTEDYKNFYNQRKDELRRMAEGEVNLMHQLKDCYNVVQYLDFDFNDWQEEDSFGTDLLIRMVLLGNLNSKMKKGSCTEDEIIQVGIDICTALEGCYAHNIIHRDIKPDNIFMNEHSYLLGDFGISKIIKNGMTAQTNTGTAHYAAPEQFKQTGMAMGYDHRVDIYSLGLTLYVLANKGKLPFTENLYNTQLAIQLRLSGKQFPILEGVNLKLQEIILKACSFKADDRYKNATEMKKYLMALKEISLNGTPTLSVGGCETEPALSTENSYETQPAISITRVGYETQPALSATRVGYETQPALSATRVGYETEPVLSATRVSYETEPVLSTLTQKEEPKQEMYKAPMLQMEKVETTAEDISLKSEIATNKPMEVQSPQQEPLDNLDYKAIAHECVLRGDHNAALDAFLNAIDQGEWNAMYYEVNQMFLADRDIKKNAELAVFWYQNCITYGKDSWTVSLAEYRLGEIYAKGLGVKKNHKYAEELFSKSASKGNPYAKKKFVAGKYVK